MVNFFKILRHIGFSLILVCSLVIIFVLLIGSKLNFSNLNNMMDFDFMSRFNILFISLIVMFMIGILLIIYSCRGILIKIIGTSAVSLMVTLVILSYLSVLMGWNDSFSIPLWYLEFAQWIYYSSFIRVHLIFFIVFMLLIVVFFIIVKTVKFLKFIIPGIVLFFIFINTINPFLDTIKNIVYVRFFICLLVAVYFLVLSIYYFIRKPR